MPDEPQPRPFGDVRFPDDPRERELGTTQPSIQKPSVPFTTLVGRIVIGIIAILFTIFAVLNLQRVDFQYIFGESLVRKEGEEVIGGGVPLIVLLVASFVLGMIVGSLMGWRRRRRGRAYEEARARALLDD